MKKGFTLVELAIVLVVIGMILGMAMKGKQLIDSARMRAEVTKFVKMETASAIYLADHAILPQLKSPKAVVDQELLFKYGLSARDMMSMYGTYYLILSCRVDNDSLLTIVNQPAEKYSDHCVFLSDQKTLPSPGFDKSNIDKSIKGDLYCNLENILDDRNPSGGNARILHTKSIAPYTSAYFDACYGKKDDVPSWFLLNY